MALGWCVECCVQCMEAVLHRMVAVLHHTVVVLHHMVAVLHHHTVHHSHMPTVPLVMSSAVLLGGWLLTIGRCSQEWKGQWWMSLTDGDMQY